MNSSTPGNYCLEKAAPPGSSLYYSILFYPADIKRELNALHAFHHEIEQIIEECSDPGVAHMKLAWWIEEIQRLFTGTPRHPVSMEFAEVISHHALTSADLNNLIRHYEQRINPVWPVTYQDLLDYLIDGPGSAWKLSSRICGIRNQLTPEIASRMGCLFGLFYLLEDRKTNQYFPQAQQTEFIRNLIIDMKDCCRKLPEDDHKAQTGVLIMANIILRTCEEILHETHNISQYKTSLTPLRKFWIAWRTHRKVMRTG